MQPQVFMTAPHNTSVLVLTRMVNITRFVLQAKRVKLMAHAPHHPAEIWARHAVPMVRAMALTDAKTCTVIRGTQ